MNGRKRLMRSGKYLVERIEDLSLSMVGFLLLELGKT